METATNSMTASEVAADAQAVIDHVTSGKPLDPEVVARVRAQAKRIREEIRRKHGTLDIGVSLIRELRGDLPSS